MLSIKNLEAGYGKVKVLHGISMEVPKAKVVTLIGSNGAGKTTTMRALSGMIRPTAGEITLGSKRIDGLESHRIARLGLAHSPEGRQIFTNLSVEENLRLGAYLYADQRVERDMEDAFQMFPILRAKRHLAAGGLSGGQQQMLAMARALMGRPSCLLLDEPSMGLAPIIVQQIFDVIRGLKALGVTVLLIEQNAYGSLQIADRGYVMETGNITMQGAASALIADPRIRAAYLGI